MFPLRVFFIVTLLTVQTANGQNRLRIIHTNDMHARFEQTSQLSGKCSDPDANSGRCYGGFARLLTAVNQQRSIAEQNGSQSVFLNAGDSFQGTIYYSLFKWEVVAAFINKMGIDAMSLGNHEFDDGPSGLAPYLRNVTVPVVACNVNFTGEPDLANTPVVPALVLNRGNMRIGVIGYLTPETETLSQPGEVKISDEIAAITSEVTRLKAAGVSIIIALGHSGYERDMEIARSVPDIDIVVGGHSHSFLYTGNPPDSEIAFGDYPTMVKQPSGRVVPVVQAYAFTKYLGVIDLVFDDQGEVTSATGSPILLNSSIPEDPEVLSLLNKWKMDLDNGIKESIGMVRVLLNGTCRFFECNLGNLITDAFVDYGVRNMIEQNWTGAAIAIYSGGGVRAAINPTDGSITREDVITTMPFMNTLVAVSVSGLVLLEALEWSVARYDPNFVVGRGEFLQVSGIHVSYDLSKEVGSRVVSAKALCSNCLEPAYFPIDKNENYSIIAASYLVQGGDNYTMISGNKVILNQFDSTDTDVVMSYIQRQNIIYSAQEERIRFVSNSSAKSSARSHQTTGAAFGLCLNVLCILFSKF